MKKYLYLLFLSLSLSNCYTYKASAESDDVKETQQETRQKLKKQMTDNVTSMDQADLSATPSNKTIPVNTNKPKATNIMEKLEPNKFYKIDVAEKSYKIQVDKWESDSLVAHVIHKPKKILKFHKNQINQSTIAERRFSQPVADIITVTAYAGIGAGIWAIIKK
ncbi:hypothetical protein [Epilithonimonas vandammei]|uniref:Lipoprotein n=1 Tax=Epilithonimonas vandammei TaxID=2487072 RepID=A0A3G8Y0X0_9FLAO|nr:hypothetical protein [Epilithonimonas vandammei]AZI38858.1 hypothetical protein EIB74_02300 [Epilithonimonas vandammei]